MNIYSPSRKGLNPNWPTLAKLRILSNLRRNEMQVHELVTQLGSYGVPREVTIDSLNELHDKSRLLVWFSTNVDLQADVAEDNAQYVSISEHGLGYLRNIVGDFEYMWYCALGVPEHDEPHEASIFPTRLKHFARLIAAVGETEWKQLMFRKCLATELEVEGATYSPGELFTLWLLYSSLTRAVASSRFALSHQDASSEYARETGALLRELAHLIVVWQERYRLCYGDEHSTIPYQSFIEQVRVPLEELCAGSRIQAECRETIEAVMASWSRTPADRPAKTQVDESEPPRDDFVTACAKYTRGLVPGIQNYLAALDKVEAARIFFWQYIREREKMTRLLENRLPVFSQVERYLDHLVKGASLVVESSKEIAATGTTSLNWFVSEQKWLQEAHETLCANSISGSSWSMVDMDDKKVRCNNIMAVVEGISRRFGARRTDHLSARWIAGG